MLVALEGAEASGGAKSARQQVYRSLVATQQTIPLFSRDWWLDCVCGPQSWDVAIVESAGVIVGAMPFYPTDGRLGRVNLAMPPLTQTMGPWLRYPKEQSQMDRLSFEKEVLTKLIAELPPHDYFMQRFHYSQTNWLPFYWQGFRQTTRYTYVLADLSDIDRVQRGFSHAKRKNIKRARDLVEVKFDLGADRFYNHLTHTLQQRGEDPHYSCELFGSVHDSVYAHHAGRTIYAEDSSGEIHSALLIIWDTNSAFDLVSTIDMEYRNGGSATLLVLEAIRLASQLTSRFDFEGSMVEGIEHSFRQFGATQVPYFEISRLSRRERILDLIRELTRTLRRKEGATP
jgi:hypothetical protein